VTPQGPRVTVQIEQYLLCSAAQLTSCSSPTATASWLTSSMLPLVSLGASQLLKPAYVDTTAKLRPQASVLALRAAGENQLMKPASTAPRSYGRRHRSWHHGHAHATHNERRRGEKPAHHDQVNACCLGHRHGHHDHSPAMSTAFIPPCSAASFVVNLEPHTEARPSVRLCVGPELARCVHIYMYMYVTQTGRGTCPEVGL
jgi:hypothetical protein